MPSFEDQMIAARSPKAGTMKPCERCGIEYEAWSHTAKFCAECKVDRQRELAQDHRRRELELRAIDTQPTLAPFCTCAEALVYKDVYDDWRCHSCGREIGVAA